LFDCLNSVNASMQGKHANILLLAGKVPDFGKRKKKMDIWVARLSGGNFDMFPKFSDFIQNCGGSVYCSDLKAVIVEHVTGLKQQFVDYLHEDHSSVVWVCDPFVTSVVSTDLFGNIEQQFIEIAKEFPQISTAAVNVEDDLRLSLWNIESRIDLLCSSRQAQMPH
ncbi:ZBED5 protein, partial [Polyodon spathula]|nr:ZBED5 protein [Polyodon spathula]